MNRTVDLLNFIINQKLDLDDFDSLVKPLDDNFVISMMDGEYGTISLISAIKYWETSSINESLEFYLNKQFVIK